MSVNKAIRKQIALITDTTKGQSIANCRKQIYTDGSGNWQNGLGGWSYVKLENGKVIETNSGSSTNTTSNRMEMMGVIEGLRSIVPGDEVEIYSDSAYVINGILQRWWLKWIKNGWFVGNSKKPVCNRDLWEEIIHLVNTRAVFPHHIPGHKGNPQNELADRLARKAYADLLYQHQKHKT